MANEQFDWAELRSGERTLLRAWMRQQLQDAITANNAPLIRRWRVIIHNILPFWERLANE